MKIDNDNSKVEFDIIEEYKKDSNDLSTNDLVDKFFEDITCGNKDIEKLLYEVIGYSLSRTSKLSKAFIFKGTGRNGKSKIFRIIEKLSSNKCSHEHLENLSGSKAGSKNTVMKLKDCTVNISEDQKQIKYINSSLITRIISGETISIGKEEITPVATLLFSVNEVIDFKETGIYITDRFVVIPFNATFTDKNNNRDIHIEDKICKEESLKFIASKSMEAFKQVLANGKFTIPSIVEEETKKYFLDCNNVAQFCNHFPINKIINKARYYKEYCIWCNNNNYETVCNSKFGKEVLNLGYRAERYSFKSDRKTYYTAQDFNNDEAQDMYQKYLIDSGISNETADNYSEEELVETFHNKPFDDYLWDMINTNC